MVSGLSDLRYLRGVGPKRAEALREEGIAGYEDLLYVLPFRWEDRRAFAFISELKAGSPPVTLAVEVVSARLIRTRRRSFTIFRTTLADESGSIMATFFNQPYLQRVFVPGARIVVFGQPKPERRAGSKTPGPLGLENPEYERLADDDDPSIHTGRIVPVYRKLGPLGSKALRSAIWGVLAELTNGDLGEIVPASVLRRHGLPSRKEALFDVHFPPPTTAIADLEARATPAQRALAFEEIFVVQLALAERRRGAEAAARTAHYEISDALRAKLAQILPFRLTAAQQQVLREIGGDLRKPHPMNRLLQGDVGSGKTIVALLTLLVAVENGYQAALMAPTEILADQHARNVLKIFRDAGYPAVVSVLTGSLKSAARRRALEDIATGRAQLVVGTHALFESGVEFKRLGLVVVDEQHRFGVRQRAALAAKGERPDLLVMTATPIPRSLALTVYGDLDLSVIDELPPGRTPVTTLVRTESDRERVYAGIRKEVAAGRQVYVVVPLVEETATSDLKAATAFAAHLRKHVFPKLAIGLLHGRLKSEEKDRVMAEFVRGAIQILVATTVVEVGVDVPNATVMVIEHAERFGLSQLHQLRGRVGRGAARSYCLLMEGAESDGQAARARLRTMETVRDGFAIAEKDLVLRGPGAVFGTQQHGLTDLQFLGLILRDPGLLEDARDAAIATAKAGHARAILDGLTGPWRRRLALGDVL